MSKFFATFLIGFVLLAGVTYLVDSDGFFGLNTQTQVLNDSYELGESIDSENNKIEIELLDDYYLVPKGVDVNLRDYAREIPVKKTKSTAIWARSKKSIGGSIEELPPSKVILTSDSPFSIQEMALSNDSYDDTWTATGYIVVFVFIGLLVLAMIVVLRK